MPKQVSEQEQAEIENILRDHPDGATVQEIAAALRPKTLPKRTLQHRLKRLADYGRILKEGDRRWTKYRLPSSDGVLPVKATSPSLPQTQSGSGSEFSIPISSHAANIRMRLRAPIAARTPVGYKRDFLEKYRPNVTHYLTQAEREHLAGIGRPNFADQPAGTYAKQIMSRLLIDLSWNSSRLEGNTYSLLDTKRLIEFGDEAEGRNRLEAQMILNHKDAIEFLVSEAESIGFNRYTLLNLHGMLANNLLPDEAAAGRLRHISVGIDGSVFHPLAVPQIIEECFEQILATASAIEDPFEQALFAMAQLPYLQPFDDVNKRVSRLGANIPFIKKNLCPLAFTDVPKSDYTDAMLGIYEFNEVDLLKEVFIWAYERSAQRYAAMRQSLGEPDPFRMKHRDNLRHVMAEIMRGKMGRKTAAEYIAEWTKTNISPADQEQFREVSEREILSLHEGNFARYRVRQSEFSAWQEVWHK
jgi:Fic family protein